MEPTLFSFIWKYSRRQQLALLAFTLLSFPFLYVTLELPKRIINDAIGAKSDQVNVFGVPLSQLQFLTFLCLMFLAMVTISGLMKMRINTLKGVLAERLLRRLRYQLLSRMMRFPKSYFRTTSQGELVSMITSEAEPMGGLMGDAVAQPVFQFGQMMTIVVFLFLQSPWFGLASVALIPVQAWLIPILQRQINLLNKARIQQVRALASEIGETAAGISDLRINGGWRYRLALLTDRLGNLFGLRFKIYQKKFFMKFVNNFITQMTPFLFYLVGGYLAIVGEISVGALVAALGAYKDLSSPWKALLFYYNQTQDMALRWQIVTERFAPSDMVPEEVFEGQPDDIPHLRGPIELAGVTVRDQDGNTVLEDIDLDIPAGSRVAIQCRSAVERRALADVLTREVVPIRGAVTLSGHPLNRLHQAVIAARIGYAQSRPYLFDGTLGDNLLMPLKIRPMEAPDAPDEEALQSGNSADPLGVDWVDPALAGLTDADEIRDWWFRLVEAMGIDDAMFRRTLRSRFDPARYPDLARAIVALRPEIEARLKQTGLDRCVNRFDPDRFNPSVPLGGNLLYAAPATDLSLHRLAREKDFIAMLGEQKLDDATLDISQAVVQLLHQTFGRDGVNHPLFLRLGIEDQTFQELCDIAEKRMHGGDDAISADEKALMITVPFLLSAEQIGPDFPEEYKERILAIRKSHGASLRERTGGLFVALDPDACMPRLTVLENAIFGRVSASAGAAADNVENEVAAIIEAHGLRRQVAATIYDLPTGLGGAKLPGVFQERAAFSRAGIKRPDILILDRALASHDSDSRAETRTRLRQLLPDSTILFIEDSFEHPEAYDLFVEIENGRIDGIARATPPGAGGEDFRDKLRIVAATGLFSGLDGRNQRLLAFSAQTYEADPGEVIFSRGQPADAVYLCLEGRAELRWPENTAGDTPVSVVGPGRLIGDLAIILKEPRLLDLVSVTGTRFLRIGAEEFRAVLESDARVAVSLLESVAGHLAGLAPMLHMAGTSVPDSDAGANRDV